MHYIMMIRKFRHRGLERFFTKGDHGGIPAARVDRIARILDRLDAAVAPADLNLPGYRWHALKGGRRGDYAVAVSGNWRVTFRFDGEDAIDVDLEDYH